MFHKMRGISSLVEDLLASQEVLCSMELVSLVETVFSRSYRSVWEQSPSFDNGKALLFCLYGNQCCSIVLDYFFSFLLRNL